MVAEVSDSFGRLKIMFTGIDNLIHVTLADAFESLQKSVSSAVKGGGQILLEYDKRVTCCPRIYVLSRSD